MRALTEPLSYSPAMAGYDSYPSPFSGLSLLTVFACVLSLAVACGGRTDLYDSVDAEGVDVRTPEPEACNTLDDDLDSLVDEDWRDDQGRYVDMGHCGGCNMPCEPMGLAREVACLVIEGAPVCAATTCADGFAPSPIGECVPLFSRLCLTCLDDADCGAAAAAACAEVAGERRCVVSCEFGCPDGYTCRDNRCEPQGGSCACGPGDVFDLACGIPVGNEESPMTCAGTATCRNGVLSECVAPGEVCDMTDNDCDGQVDEVFRNASGGYNTIEHCGDCGVDCRESAVPEGDLTCGGDPFAPRCVLDCPDARDGLDIGDEIDADGDIATGCECTLQSFTDEPGPIFAVGQNLDVNCDGAEGVVTESIYVAPDGNDNGPGSPSRPLRTLEAAMALAESTLDTDRPRRFVFVASGSYTETLRLRDGVQVFGGYRRDFLALDPNGFRVEVRAPVDTAAPGGAALQAENVGMRQTSLRWMTFIGRDSTEASSAAFGGFVQGAGRALEIREVSFFTGVPGAGASGAQGSTGTAAMDGQAGDPPRAAREDASNFCQIGSVNVVAGGRGSQNTCGGVNVSGGSGGSPSCPNFANQQPAGTRGQGPIGGSGGSGGQDSNGPITGSSCPRAVCCGLADFSVPTMFQGPQSGQAGGDGRVGNGGRSCLDALGRFDAGRWVPNGTSGGTDGTAGSGGGGGGAGGGAEMDFFRGECEFPDGLGGGGGGGGAGGCGGEGGEGGTSGGPAVALVVLQSENFALSDTRFTPADGGRGGDGGAGGDGGSGGQGGLGTEVPIEDRSTPTLAGPFAGGRGGFGGAGGAGGGGGGGCGGSSIGVWVSGGSAGSWEAQNTFDLGRAGLAGRGGGGGAPGDDGAEGIERNVHVD